MRHFMLYISLALGTVAASMAVIPASALALSEGHYCEEIVPAKTDCAVKPGNPWDWFNGVLLLNYAEYPKPESVSVCEHTYRRSNGETVSDRCANKLVGSEGDLEGYYNNGIELSGHAGNNSANPKTINGIVFF